jgi:hypothetical protein
MIGGGRHQRLGSKSLPGQTLLKFHVDVVAGWFNDVLLTVRGASHENIPLDTERQRVPISVSRHVFQCFALGNDVFLYKMSRIVSYALHF